jgi:hypothetical protein
MPSKPCEHGRNRYVCKECKTAGTGGVGICEHNRVRNACKICGGSQVCEHGHIRTTCKKCGGGGVCSHGRERGDCGFCSPARRFAVYQRHCEKDTGRIFELTFEQFAEITHQPCKYCGKSWEFLSSLRNGPLLGIDRWDNSLGYTVQNSVSCCTLCNFAKRDIFQTGFEFVEHCRSIVAHASEKEKS